MSNGMTVLTADNDQIADPRGSCHGMSPIGYILSYLSVHIENNAL